MKRLFQILFCVAAALALIPLHGESADMMEYEFETEVAVTVVSASDSEQSAQTQEKDEPAPTVRTRRFDMPTEPVHRLCVAVDRSVRFCVFRE